VGFALHLLQISDVGSSRVLLCDMFKDEVMLACCSEIGQMGGKPETKLDYDAQQCLRYIQT
jgi:hypothetical protein